jgi:hypothetical protein
LHGCGVVMLISRCGGKIAVVDALILNIHNTIAHVNPPFSLFGDCAWIVRKEVMRLSQSNAICLNAK